MLNCDKRFLRQFLAIGFGSGLLPKMPGTWGTIAAIPLVLLMAKMSLILYLIITLGGIILGIWICDKMADDLGVHDHPSIVWDEIVGFMITMVGVPISVYTIIAGFILFRVFDILKPFPILWIDKKVKGGVGIMLDDILAGVYASFGIQGIVYLTS